jgi:ubiquinone/menaquinone biosynthesis C-methylase UbiE
MGLYNNLILPRLCDLAMRNKDMLPYRERVIGGAEGCVLEIGIGSGLNLPFYRNIREIIGLEPAPRLIAMARRAAENMSTPVTFIEGSAVAVPIEDRSIDTVVTTWTLCTIADAASALSEMRRVLKPNGRLLFVEHGIAPDASVRVWQNWVTPPWKRISGGCHLNRPIGSMIAGAGFKFERLETGYMPGLKPMAFLYQGSARP